MGSGETVIIVPDNSDQTDTSAVDDAANAASEAASDSADAATVSVAAAEVSTEAAASSAESAEASANSAVVSTEAASRSEMTLQGLADLVDKLPERLAQVMGPPRDSAPVQNVEPTEAVDEEPEPIKRKPDKKPDRVHPYFRKWGKNK